MKPALADNLSVWHSPDEQNGCSSTCFFMTKLMVAAAGATDFNRVIAPLIAKRCLECHNERNIKGEVNLTTQEGFSKGTKNGRLLLDLVTQGEMPPKQKGLSQKLPDNEILILAEWVE
ncbi:MAG TPA: hypothetical protein DGJ56_08145, partial [Verrucomicrobiales bacterium]|nr:hypothetical protein [Verrucomicrobiales bacterium]